MPIGIEDFEKMRTEGFYYVDKTGMITELLNNWSEVNLFTRPRRFGKSLNMSMLKYFFSFGCNPKLFDGLAISEEKELCEKYMGKFPVISITLKGVEARDYEGALSMLHYEIQEEARRFRCLSDSSQLSEEDKKEYQYLIRSCSERIQKDSAKEGQIRKSLRLLSRLLRQHYGQKVILLIDEYDVPLDKANQYGYYEEMIDLIRSLFGQALKTNEHLFFAVLTGCLRVAKESIFTGLNNFNVISVTSTQFDEHFGFSDAEVKAMLESYGLEGTYSLMKEWYDGYRFGNTDVYCPWDVINYVYQLRSDPEARPRAFWMNSSGNAILRTLLQKATSQTMEDLDQLVNGLSVTKKISEELTYRELYDSTDHLWSVLFTTGYLTKRRETALNTYELVIPNQEIRTIFTEQILSWFQEEARKDAPSLDAFCEAFSSGKPAEIEHLFSSYLRKTISIRDTAVRKEKKENFYHGILLGLLSHRGDWILSSNAESGKGYSDILIRIHSISVGIVIEIKYSESRNLETACRQALKQIEEKNYADQLIEDDMSTILKYGIACRRNTCMVKMAET
ncbi:MAG: ATP-binding protein [Lachnospiraceae bacterium]|nr:ATP-binding protein [Lachnospiraceae bacterium]